MCMQNNMGLRMQMARTLALLRTLNPKKEYTPEEVQRYTVLYSTTAALVDIADCFHIEPGYLTGDIIDEYEKEDMIFRTENVVVNGKRSDTKQEAPSKPMTNIAPVSMGTASEEDYLKEIAALRSKINEKELENKNLREMYRQKKGKENYLIKTKN